MPSRIQRRRAEGRFPATNNILTFRQMTKYDPPMRSAIAILKAASDETRVRILLALSKRELCVCQITAVLDLAPSTVSKHLSILYGAELVRMSKRGKWVFYSIAGADAPKRVRQLLDWVIASARGSEAARRDLKKLGKITAVPPEVLCKA